MYWVLRVIRGMLLHLIVPAIFLGIGWYGGAKHGAPELLINAVDGVLERGRAVLSPILADGAEKGKELAKEGAAQGVEIAKDAAQQGGDYVAGTVEEMLEELAEPPTSEEEPPQNEESTEDVVVADTSPTAVEKDESPTPPPAAETPPAATATNTGDIAICGGIKVSNAPRTDANGKIADAGTTVSTKGVSLLLQPATNSCFSSGYGSRGGRLHRGIDYFTKTGGDVLAAGSGTIVEAVSRSDYGNMIVIDHGNGVYTRYAHLARFNSNVREGTSISMGQKLGPIGMSGSSSVIHLHYEILMGDFNTPAKSFGLESVDPFSL